MNKKILFTFLAILFSFAIVNGQENVVIHLVDNTNVTVPISNIQRITFGSDNMLLKPVTGAEQSYLLDNVALITFLDETSGIHETHGVGQNIEVNVYLNSSGEVVAESPHPIIGLTLFDLNGRSVSTSHQSHINVNSLSMGIYVLKIETTQGTVTKKIVKNR